MESASDSDAEEVEESSHVHSQLLQFREKWQAEIQNRNPSPLLSESTTPRSSPVPKASSTQETLYEKAKELFLNGVWSEQNGLVYEAMEYYRKATKIIPDIDIQMTAQYRQQSMPHNDVPRPDLDSESIEGGDISDLCSRFGQICFADNEIVTYCSMDKPQRSTHISSLPAELLTYILRWLISSEVDARSLEQFSTVCRGFYMLSRDPHLWQDICVSTWGVSCQSFQPYAAWRSMFIEKPHLYYHGIYMNKVELYRQGEATLEKYYPPWLKVVYYRYLRFFADGLMCMYTSSADPITSISQLRNSNAQMEGMCKGMYRIKEDQVSCILKRVKCKEKTYQRYKKKRDDAVVDSETTFYIDLSLHSLGCQPNSLLKWEKYTVSVYYPDTGNESSNDFALTSNDFPPCKFANVKSYTSESSSPLAGR